MNRRNIKVGVDYAVGHERPYLQGGGTYGYIWRATVVGFEVPPERWEDENAYRGPEADLVVVQYEALDGSIVTERMGKGMVLRPWAEQLDMVAKREQYMAKKNAAKARRQVERAGPDLLAALQLAVQYIPDGCIPVEHGRTIDAAIAKALA